MLFGAFQHESFYREVEPRYRRLAEHADEADVFADFPSRAPRRRRARSRSRSRATTRWATSGRSSSTRPGYAACLLAWEQPGVTEPGSARDLEPPLRGDLDRRPAPRPARAALAAARLVGRSAPEDAERLSALLRRAARSRSSSPAPALTALTNRIVAYLEDLPRVAPAR